MRKLYGLTSKMLLLAVIIVGIIALFHGVFRNSNVHNTIVYCLILFCAVINRFDSRKKGSMSFEVSGPAGIEAKINLNNDGSETTETEQETDNHRRSRCE